VVAPRRPHPGAGALGGLAALRALEELRLNLAGNAVGDPGAVDQGGRGIFS